LRRNAPLILGIGGQRRIGVAPAVAVLNTYQAWFDLADMTDGQSAANRGTAAATLRNGATTGAEASDMTIASGRATGGSSTWLDLATVTPTKAVGDGKALVCGGVFRRNGNPATAFERLVDNHSGTNRGFNIFIRPASGSAPGRLSLNFGGVTTNVTQLGATAVTTNADFFAAVVVTTADVVHLYTSGQGLPAGTSIAGVGTIVHNPIRVGNSASAPAK
jgi:hypothetical protein